MPLIFGKNLLVEGKCLALFLLHMVMQAYDVNRALPSLYKWKAVSAGEKLRCLILQ